MVGDLRFIDRLSSLQVRPTTKPASLDFKHARIDAPRIEAEASSIISRR